ncbi:MAG: hypothetical protein ACKO3P_23670 [Planctomycetaceae bacterium]
MNAPQALIERYLDEEATASELATLEAWLLADPANARELAEQAAFHDQLLNWWRVHSSIESAQSAANWPLGEGAFHEAVTASRLPAVGPQGAADAGSQAVGSGPGTRLLGKPSQASNCETVVGGANPGPAFDQHPAQASPVNQFGPGQLAGQPVGRGARLGGPWGRWSVVAVLLGALALLWAFQSRQGTSELLAGTLALEQLIESRPGSSQRVFLLTVEKSEPLSRARSPEEERRPRKPTLEGALLSIGLEGRFVLERQTEGGEPFVTGSNGVQSWAVRPWGPVLVSRDPTRFRRDLPGQDLGFPLVEIDTVLAQLKAAYTIRLQAEVAPGLERLVASKHRRTAGPRVVEVTYDSARREIRSLRFIDLAYGTNRLTLRLDESPLSRPVSFFEHASHHAPTRRVEYE